MKNSIYKITIIFIALFFLCFNNSYSQYDISIKFNETEMNNALAAIVEARGLNWGDYKDSFIIENWFANVDLVTADIKPGNQTTLNVDIVIVGEIDMWLFQFDVVEHLYGPIEGNLVLEGNNNVGRKLIFYPTSADLDHDGDVPEWIMTLIGWFVEPLDFIPPIPINFGTALMPEAISELFTTESPELITNNNEIIIGYTFEGPRKLKLQNDFDGNNMVGTVEALQNEEWVQYSSPHTFWWELNSEHIIRAKSGTVNHLTEDWKFYYWNEIDESKNLEKSILIDQDLNETAFFKPVLPLTLQTNLLEGGTGGMVVYEQEEFNSPFNNYEFQPPYTTNIGAYTQFINGHRYYLSHWQDGNTSNSRNISLTSPSTYTANLVGTQVSNQPNAYNSNNQRKCVRLGNSNSLFNIYKSLNNKIWVSHYNSYEQN